MNLNENSIFQTKRMSSRKKPKLQDTDFIQDLDNIDLIKFELFKFQFIFIIYLKYYNINLNNLNQ